MKLYEFMAKDILRQSGVPVPRGRVARTPAEAVEVAREVCPAAIKSQVLAGGRGKAGGIRFAETPEEAGKVAAELLGAEVRGLPVEAVLVEEKLSIDREMYLGVAVDARARRPIVLASRMGGVDIEEVPEEEIYRKLVDTDLGLRAYAAREVARRLGLSGETAREVARIATVLYSVFRQYDAELVEINPLVLCGERVVAADARLNIDDDAVYRQKGVPHVTEGSPLELKAKELGLAYVQLDGDIAVMANGAGITMATLDVLRRYGGSPANFLDAGGGAGVEPMARALEILLSTKPKAILVNIFGGITRCDDVARALVRVKSSLGIPVPLVVRLVGTNEEQAVSLLREHGMDAFRSMDHAARKVVELARPR